MNISIIYFRRLAEDGADAGVDLVGLIAGLLELDFGVSVVVLELDFGVSAVVLELDFGVSVVATGGFGFLTTTGSSLISKKSLSDFFISLITSWKSFLGNENSTSECSRFSELFSSLSAASKLYMRLSWSQIADGVISFIPLFTSSLWISAILKCLMTPAGLNLRAALNNLSSA